MSSKTIYLIDGYNLIYRLFYAVPPFTTKAGKPVNAVFGIAKTLLWIHEYEKPDLLYFVMDARGPSFREALFPEYKWTRDRMPDDLKSQEECIFDLLKRFGIPVLEKSGYEADDIIGTLVTQLRKDESNTISILSGDKDLYQFIGGNVVVYDTMKRKVARREDAIEKFWVPPEHVVDYLAITGDSSDNIPWIMGFWPKKAQTLIGEFGSLEQIYEALDSGNSSISWKVQATLIEQREMAFLSKKLATIPTDVPLELPDENMFLFAERSLMNEEVLELFRQCEFKSLLPEGDSPLWTFSQLGLTVEVIDTIDALNQLEKYMEGQKTCSLATVCANGTITHVVLYFGTAAYCINLIQVSARDFLERLLQSQKISLVWFEIKEELKLIQSYIKNSSQSGEEQVAMIF
jgi:DNA polymerase I